MLSQNNLIKLVVVNKLGTLRACLDDSITMFGLEGAFIYFYTSRFHAKIPVNPMIDQIDKYPLEPFVSLNYLAITKCLDDVVLYV